MDGRVKLDDSSYDLLYEKAMGRLRRQAPWWTHREVSDPGITLLEMWAILTDMQSCYLDQLQESHFRKYNKLLGQKPDAGEAAEVWISFSEVKKSTVLPRGTKLLADKIVFELKEETKLLDNEIKGVYRDPKYNLKADMHRKPEYNLAPAMYMFRKNRFALSRKEFPISFTLEKEPETGEFSFFVLLDERNGRIPAGENFRMAEVAWEYYCENGWREAGLVRDETCGLLYSGRVCLKLKQRAVCAERGFCEIRCHIKKDEYDVMPVIYRISLNVAKAVQKNTLCCTEERQLPPEEHSILLETYLARTGELTVLRRTKNGLWENITSSCKVGAPITAQNFERRVLVPAAKAGQDNLVRIVCSAPGLREVFPQTLVTGVTTQIIPLPWNNVKRETVRLLLRKGDDSGLYEEYKSAEPEDCLAKAWHWAEEEDAIILGDGRHGEIPVRASDGILFEELAVWEGGGGNVAIGRVEKWERPELFSDIVPINSVPARGGRNRQKPSEQFALLGKQLLRRNRMVTQEDIRELALETPGLLLRDAEAVWKDGVIEVKVFPQYSLTTADCREIYRKAVQAHLERFRLVGTCVRVTVSEEKNDEAMSFSG